MPAVRKIIGPNGERVFIVDAARLNAATTSHKPIAPGIYSKRFLWLPRVVQYSDSLQWTVQWLWWVWVLTEDKTDGQAGNNRQ